MKGIIKILWLLYCSTLILLLFSCAQRWVETVGKPGEFREESEPVFGFSFSTKKNNRLSASYPPLDLIDGLKKYRVTYNSWPNSFYELYAVSPIAQKAISNMLQTNYSDIIIQKSTPDSLEITYKYHSVSKEKYAKSEIIILNNKTSKRKYLFLYNRKDSSVFIDNIKN